MSIFAVVAVLVSPGAYGERQADTTCTASPDSASCYSCYLDWNRKIAAFCQAQYPLAVAGVSDFRPAIDPRASECMRVQGYREPNTVEAVCLNVGKQAEDEFGLESAEGREVTDLDSSVRPPSRRESTTRRTEQPKQSTAAKTSGEKSNSSQGTSAASATNPGQCEAAKRTAVSCCNNPDSCLTSSERDQISFATSQLSLASQQAKSNGSLNSLGSSSNASNSAASDANAVYARACFRAKSTCLNTCRGASQQDAQSSSNQSTCSRLSASAFATQSANLAGNSGQALNAAQQAQAQSAADPFAQDPMMGGNPLDPYGCVANPYSPACVQCAQNPNNPGCQALSKANAAARGEGGFASYQSGKDSKFNLADNADAYVPEPMFGSGEAGTPPTVATVANNAGGGIPGAGGSTQPASLGSARKSGGGPSAGKDSLTDLEQGFRSGGYSQPVGGGEGEGRGPGDGAGGFGGRGLASEESLNIDLKAYLPGGRMDPNTRLGGMRPFGNEIHGKFVNIWGRISDRMREKCRLGVLAGCG